MLEDIKKDLTVLVPAAGNIKTPFNFKSAIQDPSFLNMGHSLAIEEIKGQYDCKILLSVQKKSKNFLKLAPFKDIEIFEGKTFSSLVKDIYFNSSHKKEQINQLIKDLRTMVKDAGSATVIAPMIRDYIDVGVKNDDQLVKLSAVLQRIINGGSGGDSDGGGDYTLTDEEKKQLLQSAEKELKDIGDKNISISKFSSEDLEKKIAEETEDGIH